MRGRFPRTPFIKYTRGADWGLVGFDKTLSEEDVAFVKENVKQINGKDVVWSIAEGSFGNFFFSGRERHPEKSWRYG
jgi:lupus La protein